MCRHRRLHQHRRLVQRTHAHADPNANSLAPGLTITQIGGSIVPGTTDTGNHGDDQVTNVALPFSYCVCGPDF